MSIFNPNCDFRDGQEVFLDGIRVKQARLGDLTILQVELSDEGNYTCRASNVYAEIETVSGLEGIKRSGGGEGAREVMRHTRQNVTLQCGVSYDPRVHNETEVSWNKDGDILGKLCQVGNAKRARHQFFTKTFRYPRGQALAATRLVPQDV